MKSRNIILLVLLFSITTVFAQKDNCLEQVKRVYKAWEKQVQESTENTVYLKYETEITTGGEKLETNKLEIEVISNKDNSIFSSPDLKIYQDKKHTVSILKDKKVIVINGVSSDQYKKQKIGQFEVLHDTIFSQLKTIECEMVQIEGKAYKKVVLEANATARNIYKIETIYFLLDLNNNTVKEVKVKYLKNYQLAVMHIKIIDQNLDYKIKINKEVLSNVLDSNGKLLNKYTGYKLMDNRKLKKYE
ncbi:MAG: hypothetical protein F9K09_01460 [Flavobacteriales bacterium]|nr:MAG: hypothetical protein F9K09_01460 [Flavobacteriales bacterium]